MSDAEGVLARSWKSYREMVLPKNASEVQIQETRQAFYGGASLLFYSIMKLLDPGEEPTEADLQRMTDIQEEIDEFGREIDQRVLGTQPRH